MKPASLPSVFTPGDAFPDVDAARWPAKKEEIRSRILPFLGLPTNLDPAYTVPKITLMEEAEHPEGRLSKFAYEAEPVKGFGIGSGRNCARNLLPELENS